MPTNLQPARGDASRNRRLRKQPSLVAHVSCGFDRVASRPAANCPPHTIVMLLFAICSGVLIGSSAHAAEVSPENPFYAQLTAPLVSVIEGQELRVALQRVSTQAGVNLWLDRHVDPNVLVNVGQIGPTTFAAIEAIAEAGGCVAMPVHSTVIVGRRHWVLRTAASMMRAANDSSSGKKINLAWPDATHPDELWSLAERANQTANLSITVEPSFSHDVLAGNVLREISATDFVTLVLADFDMYIEPPGKLSKFDSRDQAFATAQVQCSYRVPDVVKLRRAIERYDPKAKFQSSGDGLKILANMRAHHSAITGFCRVQGPAQGGQAVAAQAAADATFDLKIINKPADVVLQQLAAASGRTLTIKSAAIKPCKSLISLEGKSRTLRQHSQDVAAKVGVEIDWQPKTVTVK